MHSVNAAGIPVTWRGEHGVLRLDERSARLQRGSAERLPASPYGRTRLDRGAPSFRGPLKVTVSRRTGRPDHRDELPRPFVVALVLRAPQEVDDEQYQQNDDERADADVHGASCTRTVAHVPIDLAVGDWAPVWNGGRSHPDDILRSSVTRRVTRTDAIHNWPKSRRRPRGSYRFWRSHTAEGR